MFIIKKKLGKKGKRKRVYYWIAKSEYDTTKKKQKHKLIMYLGTAKRILRVFNAMKKTKR